VGTHRHTRWAQWLVAVAVGGLLVRCSTFDPAADPVVAEAGTDGPVSPEAAVVEEPDAGVETAPDDNPDATIVGDAAAIPDAGRIVFVTSTGRTGALKGKAGADAICNDVAQKANLKGTYVAFIATSTVVPGAELPEGEWFLLDGKRAFASRPTIKSLPEVPLLVNELGGLVGMTARAWTGIGPSPTRCQGWGIDDGFSGTAGSPESLQASWLTLANYPCQTLLRLYCFEL
jgi:hypothetical protein